MKGDVWSLADMVECKSTIGRTISLKLDWLEKLVKEAFEAHKQPVVSLRFESAKFAGKKDWVVIPADRYHELVQEEGEFLDMLAGESL